MKLEHLIRELAGIDGMLWVVGSEGATAENTSTAAKEPTFDDGYALIEAEGWHIHLKLDSVAGIQFVEAEDIHHHHIPFLYYVRLSGPSGETLLRSYFPNPYLDANDKPTEFQPDRLKVFEQVRDRYVGKNGIEFVRKPAPPP